MIVVMKFARLVAILLSLFALTGSVPAQTSDGKKIPPSAKRSKDSGAGRFTAGGYKSRQRIRTESSARNRRRVRGRHREEPALSEQDSASQQESGSTRYIRQNQRSRNCQAGKRWWTLICRVGSPREIRSAGPARTWKNGSSSRCDPALPDARGRIERSPAARRAFRRASPCPSTGLTTGSCPGYVVDHIKALKHGGLDELGNMQWQTIEEARAKDRIE
jgi:hypothetical protein